MMGDLFGEAQDSEEEVYWDDEVDLPGAERVELPEKPPLPRGESRLCGLVNQGNTCYMNSLLQALYMTPEFRCGVFSLSPAELHLPTPECPEPEPDRQRRILIALQDLFARMQADDIEATDTQELTSSFGEGFNVNQQEDLQELKVILMDSLASELDGTSARDLLPSLFQGVYQNQIVVDPCDPLPDGFTRTLADEVFTDVFVQVRGAHTLETALRAKVTFDDLSGANQWACDEAGGVKVDANKGVSFKQLPQLLCFTLMRFEMDWMADPPTRSKITDEIAFPLELDMAPFTRGRRADGTEIAGAEQGTIAAPLVAMLYDLAAVVVHEGGAHGGHYHVYVRDVANEGHGEDRGQTHTDADGHPIDTSQMDLDTESSWEEASSPGSWFNFNDATVTRVSVDKLRSTFGGSSCAYMLVYRKRELAPSATGSSPSLSPINLPPHLLESIEIRRVALERQRAEYEDALHSVQLEVHLPSSLLSDHETGLLRVITDDDPSMREAERTVTETQAEMTEDEQLAAAIAISMGEVAPPVQPSPSFGSTTRAVALTVDSRWSEETLRQEISHAFSSMDTSKLATDDTMLYEAVCSNSDWRLEPMMFAHQYAYVGSAETGSNAEDLGSCAGHLEKSRGMTAHALAWLPPPKWPDPACVDPIATWVTRRESARPMKLSIAQLMDTTAENEEEETTEESHEPEGSAPQKVVGRPSRVERLEHGVLLSAPYLDVHTLLLKIQEKTGIEPRNQLLLCVRQGFQKSFATGQDGVGAKENLAECAGRISGLIESGVISDEAELTVEVKQAGWRAGGGKLSLAERAKAERDRVDLIHVFCDDIVLATELHSSDIAMPKGSTIEDLRQAAKSIIMSETGCACTVLGQQEISCKLCKNEYRLRRCFMEYDCATVDSTVFSAVDAELLLNDADLYSGSAVRVEVGQPPAEDELTFPVQFQDKVSQTGDMIRWRAFSRWDFKASDTVGEVKERLVEYANNIDAHPWMCETDERGMTLAQLPLDKQQAFRDSFMWYLSECQLRVGPAVTTTAISVEPGRVLKDDAETLHSAGLTENTNLYLQRGTAPKKGEVLLKLYRQISDMLPHPGCSVTGVVPLRSDQSMPVAPESFDSSMSIAELKTLLAQSLTECQLPSEESSAEAAELACRLRLRHVAGSGDKRRPLHPTTIIKANVASSLGTVRELQKTEAALAVSLLPQPELLHSTDKVFTLWQLRPTEGGLGGPQFVTPAELVVQPEPVGSSLTLEQLLAAIHQRTSIPIDQIRIAKRQVTSLAEWGPWQSVGDPISPPAIDVVTDVIDTPLPGAENVKRRTEKVHKLPDCTVLGVTDASLFPLLQEGGSVEQLLAAVEGGVHRQTLADNGESKGKKNAERSQREPDTLKIRRYGEVA